MYFQMKNTNQNQSRQTADYRFEVRRFEQMLGKLIANIFKIQSEDCT